jgi:hypothetical protein
MKRIYWGYNANWSCLLWGIAFTPGPMFAGLRFYFGPLWVGIDVLLKAWQDD